ncbi:bone morphogenetic protein 10-like [Photinus pyralis]|nr:bone morphogenetic protein 10-like [Photinus pyralis]
MYLKKYNFVNNTSIELKFINSKEILNESRLPIKASRGEERKVNKKRIHIPKIMLELYEERNRNEYGLNFSKPDIVRSVIPKNAGTLKNKILQSVEENHVLIFDVPPLHRDEEFLGAELRVFTLLNNTASRAQGVERFLKVLVYNESSEDMDLLTECHIFKTESNWINFNVTNPVRGLLKRNTKTISLKLVISVKTFLPFYDNNAHEFKLSLLPVSEDFDHDYPILLLSYMSLKTTPVHRRKRGIDEDYEEETNRIWDNDKEQKANAKKLKRLKNTCKRKPLYVNFSEIEYDTWIVQPSGYEAYQCTGKCFYPVAEHLSPTKHAIVQALLHSVFPSRAPRSCCVPTRLESISLLYVDDRGVLTYRFGYDDMVVAECGCR